MLKLPLQPACYYTGFRDDDGKLSPVHWYILTLKFAFVIIFCHFVFGVRKLIDFFVPDIPHSLDIKIKRERYLGKNKDINIYIFILDTNFFINTSS